MQGDISYAQAFSNGKWDTNTVAKYVTSYDKWNFGKPTRAYYDYGAQIADGSTLKNIDTEEENDLIYGGGILH